MAHTWPRPSRGEHPAQIRARLGGSGFIPGILGTPHKSFLALSPEGRRTTISLVGMSPKGDGRSASVLSHRACTPKAAPRSTLLPGPLDARTGSRGLNASSCSSYADTEEFDASFATRFSRKHTNKGNEALAGELQRSLHESRLKSAGEGYQLELNQSMDVWEIAKLARELSLPISDVLNVKSIFESFDHNGSGSLDLCEFEEAVTLLLQRELGDMALAKTRAKGIGNWCWFDGGDNSGCIDFKEFLKWYSSNGFNADLLLTEKEIWLRNIAKQYSLTPCVVEKLKLCFDSYDADGSGKVDVNEFKQVIEKLMKVPPNSEMPQSRIQYFWSEMDHDHSGHAVFEEFLQWWLKYFEDTAKTQKDIRPFENFYRQVRRIGREHLDPVIYPDAQG